MIMNSEMFDQFCTFNTMWDTEMLLSNAQQFFKYLRASGYSPFGHVNGRYLRLEGDRWWFSAPSHQKAQCIAPCRGSFDHSNLLVIHICCPLLYIIILLTLWILSLLYVTMGAVKYGHVEEHKAMLSSG